ncbi:hypothetical protein LRS03_05280 [Rhizobacter sp. J219]|uniref:hypothetical protein n=1 Tax=Rhizobacter sp. J219 TaxID=2898430 RepID=UPI002150A90C|nr:hypothetical protein [Rhizobacter sp. J219]MCR5882302.1 hypothetical protein [Rhizobacter sp. J219]
MAATASDGAMLDEIRSQVRTRLMNSPAFRALDKDKQRQVAHDTVNALRYIAGGEAGDNVPGAVVLGGNAGAFAPAQAMAGPVSAIKPGAAVRAMPQRGGFAAAPGAQPGGKEGGPRRQRGDLGEAAFEGSQAFTETIANVNFPGFVGGLIDGVFNSIVTTSIKQMEAYAEMVKNVSKSVDQYMKDNVTENNARDYLAERYPDHLEVDIAGDAPRLKPKEGHDENSLPDFFADLGLASPVVSIDEDNVEQQLVPAARRRIAMDRQQLLATMVMMGVNRLVVTNGTIEASCLFELDTHGARTSHAARTSDFDRTNTSGNEWGNDGSFNRSNKEKAGLFGSNIGARDASDTKTTWYSKGARTETANFKMHTASDRADEQTIDLHAKLGGKVKVNFKSDYFPMEKMVDALQVNQIRDKTAAGLAPQVVAAPAAPAPAAPPLPPMPALPAAPGVPALPTPARP